MDDYNPNSVGAPNPGSSSESADPSATRFFPPRGAVSASAQQAAQPGTPGIQGTYSQPASSGGIPPLQASNQPLTPTNIQPGQFHPPPQSTRNSERDRNLLGLILVAGGVLFLLDQLDLFGSMGNLILLVIGSVFMYAYFTTHQGHRIGFLIPGAILLGIGAGQ